MSSLYPAKLARITASVLVLIGAVLFLNYLIYLPFPGLFESSGVESLGLIFYSLATAGAGFVSWGIIMSSMNDDGVKKSTILRASALGLGMLAIMRLEVAVFPHAPFDALMFVPVSEFILFSLIAFKLYPK